MRVFLLMAAAGYLEVVVRHFKLGWWADTPRCFHHALRLLHTYSETFRPEMSEYCIFKDCECVNCERDCPYCDGCGAVDDPRSWFPATQPCACTRGEVKFDTLCEGKKGK